MKHFLNILLCLLVLTSCSHKGNEDGRPVLTVTIEPLRYFTEAIAGDKYRVISMVPEGSNPETYDPTPQQLVELAKSKAYFRIGYIGFEQAWMEKLQSNAPQLPVFDTSENVELIREEATVHHNHTHEGGVEPHIWNSTRNAHIIAGNICKSLCKLDKANSGYYQKRLDSLSAVIDRTELAIKAFMPEADPAFLIYHPALSYFARDYGLQQISIEEGGKEPSPAHLKKLVETCRNTHARIIFVQQEFDTRNALAVAKELNLQVERINPLSYNWEKEMLHIASVLAHQPFNP